MNIKYNYLLPLLLVVPFIILGFEDPPIFDARVNKGTIINDDIDEASGIAASYRHTRVLWTLNDSGGENRIFAVNDDGSHRGTFYLNGIENRDWEDIAAGPGPNNDLNYIYIGDIGDNTAQYGIKYIYRIEEPELPINPEDIITLQNVARISFAYPDGPRDAETLMIDPITKDLYIVGKRDSDVRLYRLPYPQSTQGLAVIELAAQLTLPFDPEINSPENYITGGDISKDGTEIILKSYSNVFYWSRDPSESLAEAMSAESMLLPYIKEPQGEAICWQNEDVNGYFTVSEENITINGIPLSFPAVLFYYPRNVTVGVNENNSIFNFSLSQNYPNPFNPVTVIQYIVPGIVQTLPGEKSVSLKIYDVLGREVDNLVNEYKLPGAYSTVFNGKKLESGIYIYKLRIGEMSEVKKMLLIK